MWQLLAANHEHNRKQMAVISECDNKREWSCDSHPVTTSQHFLDLKTDDIPVWHLGDDVRDEVRFGREQRDERGTSERHLVAVCE